MTIRFLAAMACALCLVGCGRSLPTNYYLLESGAPPFEASAMPGKTLRVAQAETPAYLNRNNIVSRVQGNPRLIIAEFHLWAEPVSAGVRRVIGETISYPLMKAGVNVLPIGAASGGDYVLLLDVARLDGNFNEKAAFECRWTLLDRDEKIIQSGEFSREELVKGADYDALVSAESSLVRGMGETLAEALPGIIGRRK